MRDRDPHVLKRALPEGAKLRPAYNRKMARGWESKSIEQQQEEASAEKVRRQPLTPEQITKENRRKGLELSRQRMVQQMETASNPKYRQMLERALRDLDNELKSLGSG